MNYDIKRNGIVVANVRPDGGQQRELMVQDIVPITFKTSEPIHFMHGDTIEVWGDTYKLNNPSEPTMINSNSFEYKMTFQALWYDLSKWKFKGYDAANQLTMEEWDLMGNANTFLDLIVANANRLGSGWTKGQVLVSDYKNLSFKGENILQGLSQLAEEFDTEYSFENKVIHLIKRSAKSPYKFSYGYNNGLRGELTRTNTDSSSVFSRLCVYGSDKNLPIGYKNGAKRLTIPDALGYIQGPKYGSEEIEASITFEDVMPDRIGTITSVGNIYTFSDSTIDFDVNAQTYPGLSAKIEFQTGSLAGYQFEIAKNGYTHATKTVTFLKNDAEKAFVLPSDTLKPKVGDKYRFIDIQMPQSYVDAKQDLLRTRGQEYFNKESAPKYTFGVNPDWFMFTRNKVRLNLGDTARVTALELLLDADIRMLGYTRDLHEEFKYTGLKLSNTTVIGSAITRELAKEERLEKALSQNQIYDIARARRNAVTLSEVKNLIVDPTDDKLYADMIKAASVETLYLAVGAKWTNFALKGVAFKPNVAGNPANLNIAAGQLLHYALQIDGLGFVWEMAASNITGLDPLKDYYVYAKVSRNALTGTWVVTDQIITVESVPGFWHFQTGVLFKVNEGRRDYEFTHGMTFIIGDQITAGIIKSLDGLNFFNLTNGTFNVGTNNQGLDYGVTAANRLTIRGAIMQSGSGIISPLPTYRGGYLAGAVYYKGDTVLYNGTQWIYVNDVAASNQTPADNQYWDVYASIGNSGSNGTNGLDGYFTQFRYQKNGSTTTPPALTVTDTNPAGWTTSQPTLLVGEYLWMTSAMKIPPVLTRNYFSKNTVLSGTNMTTLSHTNPTNPPINGFFAFNTTATPGSVRLMDTVKGNGKWTISGSAYANGNITVRVSFAGGATQNLNITTTDTYFSLTFDVPDSSLGYVEISNITQRSMRFNNLKIQKGSVADAWSPVPEDPEFQDLATLVGTWGAPARTSGIVGPQGIQGAYLSNTGDFKSNRQYVGTPARLEVTRYNNTYYVTRTDAGNIPVGTLPTNTSYFNPFGAQFDSVATGLLLAQLAYIENLGVRYLRTSDSGKRVVIDGDNNSMIFYDADGNEALRLDDDIDNGQTGNPLGGMRMMTPGGDTSYCSGNGFFANGSGMRFLSIAGGTDTNASVVGLLRYKNSQSTGISAAVVGVDQSPLGGTGSRAYAGAFLGNLMATGEVHTNVQGTEVGQTVELDVRVGGDVFWKMKWKNGFLISASKNP